MVIVSEKALLAELRADVRADLEEIAAEEEMLEAEMAEIAVRPDREDLATVVEQVDARLAEIPAERAKLEQTLRNLA